MSRNKEKITMKLKKFPIQNMNDNSTNLIVAARNRGKSVLCRDILYHRRDIPSGMVISCTEESNGFYSSFVPPVFINSEYSPVLLEQLLKRQKLLKRRIKKGEKDIDNRIYCVMDDCLYNKETINNPFVREIFFNGRHFNIMYILISQYSMLIPTHYRGNLDYVFLLGDNNMNNKRRLWEHYCGIFEDFSTFNQVFSHITENYGCMVIDNKSKSNKIEDVVFWYKADSNLENFKTCCDEAWKFSELTYKSDDEEEELEERENDEYYSAMNRKRRGLTVNVEKTT